MRRRNSLDVTSLNHATVFTSGGRPHTTCRQLSINRCYEQELEEQLETGRRRAVTAEQQVVHERLRRRQLVHRLDELEEVRLKTQQTNDEALQSQASRCRQLTDDLRRLQDQLRLVTTEKTRLETQQRQRAGCGVERRDVATQTVGQIDTSALYQQLASIALARLDQLELEHLPSRDRSPANQLRRSASLRADDVTRHVTSPARHHVVTPVRSWHLDWFKKLQPSRRRPITARRRRDVTLPPVDTAVTSPTTTSSFVRLQHRRNGLTDLTGLRQRSCDV